MLNRYFYEFKFNQYLEINKVGKKGNVFLSDGDGQVLFGVYR